MSDADFKKFDVKSDFAGAAEVVEAEREYLEKFRKDYDSNKISGIALSGGGIRSSSFCLGVMQALASENKLQKFDYLSTVSGGGYLGGALSWLWSGLWKDSSSSAPDFGVGKDDFPFGTEGRKFTGSEPEQLANRQKSSLLRHLRQHGNYLTPGRGINVLSLVSIVLRSVVMGFISLMLLVSMAMSVLYVFDLFRAEHATAPFFLTVAVLLILVYIAVHLTYMLYVGRHKKEQHSNPDEGYLTRRKFESLMPVLLKGVLFFVLFGAVHWVNVKVSGYFQIEISGGIAAALGALLGSINEDSKWRKFLAFMPRNTQLVVAAALMIFGLMVLADSWVMWLDSKLGIFQVVVCAILAFGVLALAKYLPINNISIHRYYRDRLMETFMPDVEKILRGEGTATAMRANRTGFHELNRNLSHELEKKSLPYHLVNTNIILVESTIAKFRGRGGDNFILSPLYSGSNATGWRSTKEFCNGSITLPSAVAISGAAANPDSGVAGQGLTTNSLVSILMSIFNLRLGYWASNPDPGLQPDQGVTPSYYYPGFWEIFKRKNMNEKAEFVQLSDGGHFENLGLYELFRRRARFIVVCDAGADPGYEFCDLANAIEKGRVDFGAHVSISNDDIKRLIPDTIPAQSDMKYPLAEKSYLVADLIYNDDEGLPPGKLVYIKTTLSKNISADIHGYKRAYPDFPDQTTVDQFFDEVQFEAYRELGWVIGMEVIKDPEVADLFDDGGLTGTSG